MEESNYSTDGEQYDRGMADDNLSDIQKMILQILFDAGKDKDGKPVCMTADEIGDEVEKRMVRKNHEN